MIFSYLFVIGPFIVAGWVKPFPDVLSAIDRSPSVVAGWER
jgi:hypothetical protein